LVAEWLQKDIMGVIKDKFAAASVAISDNQEVLLAKYLDILFDYNNRFNLTSITSWDDAVVKHLVDSVASVAYIPQGASLVDIGSGGGCPAIPLKIVRPDITLTMTDSIGKKTNFLNIVVSELGLSDSCALNIRAETLGRIDKRESFDVVTARAVAPLAILLELASPLIKLGGIFIAYKGSQDESALAHNAALALHCRLIEKIAYRTDDEYARTLLIYRKIAALDPTYPRPFAQIQRRPL